MSIKNITYKICIACLFLIPFFVLIVANSYFFPFITGKAFFFRILVEVGFAAWIILCFLDARYRPKLSRLNIAVTVFALIVLVADFLGVNPIRSLWSNFERMEGWMTIIHLWALYLMTTTIFSEADDKRKMWHRWLNTSLVVATVVALYGVGQLFGWFDIHQSSARVDATLGNSAYMAVYMLFNVFIAAYMFLQSRVKKIRPNVASWIYCILSILFAFMVLQTQTRGTILGLVGGVLLALLIFTIFGKNESKKWRKISGSIIGLVVILIVLFWFNRHQTWIESNPILGRFSNISWNEASNQARQYVWPMALNGAMERPILGWGQENFNYIFNENYNPKMWSQEQWFDRAHSVYLDWLVASGLLGLIAYLALYVLLIMTIVRSGMRLSEKSVLIGLVAGYAIHNVFVFDNLASYVMFFSILAFVNSFGQNRDIKLLGKNSVRQDIVEYVVSPIVVILLVGSIYFLNVRVMQANRGLIKALTACQSSPDLALFEKIFAIDAYVANQESREQLLTCSVNVISSPQIPTQMKVAFFDLVEREMKKQITATPNDAREHLFTGSFYNSIGEYAKAEPYLEKAHELSPSKQTITFDLANSYMMNNKTEKAVEVLKKAYEDATDFTQAKNLYIISLIFNGKESEAKNIFKDEPELFETEQIAQVYVIMKQYAKAVAIYKKRIAADPNNVDLVAKLAEIYYKSGSTWEAVNILRSLQKDRPDLKEQIESMIEQIQK